MLRRNRMPMFAKLLILVFAVGIALVLFSAWKEMHRSERIEEEVGKLREEAERIRNENRTISERIAYFSTPEFEEREAKEKLGLAMKDEVVVSVDTADQTVSPGTDRPIVAPYGPVMSNYRKWWEFFFEKR